MADHSKSFQTSSLKTKTESITKIDTILVNKKSPFWVGNCIRLTNNNLGTKHTEQMIATCLEFLENKVPFITEAIFTDGSRCDILCPSTKDIIEILHTETDEMFKDKIKKYPAYFNVLKVRV